MKTSGGLLAVLMVVWHSGTDAMPPLYAGLRQAVINVEQETRLGNTVVLNRREQVVDAMLREDKQRLTEAARTEGAFFPASHNFLKRHVRQAMENTSSFQIIRKMPKGGLLHLHKTASVTLDWVVKNVTYRPNLHFCVRGAARIVNFKFASTTPNSTADCEWLLMSSYREKICQSDQPCLDTFDSSLYRNLSLVTEDPEAVYPDIFVVWDKFEIYFDIINDLLQHVPVWRDYTWRMLQELLQDNVQYVEMRGSLPMLYELDGSTHSRTWCVDNIYMPLIRAFQQQNPQFIGVKFIMTKFRGGTPEQILSYVQEAISVYQNYGNFVVGFDLVGQEDPFNPLVDFVDPLLYPLQQTPPIRLPYFFHAGETVWQRTATDLNLVDALLLNATRIGHGYALHKHPMLMEMVKQWDIPVEVNPISNQVLKLVADLRNHPAAALLARGFPIVIGSDDPALWDSLPLTHDFYVTFMALTAQDDGLAQLKQLAINSIKYSRLTRSEKVVAMAKWTKSWKRFIDEVCAISPLCPQEGPFYSHSQAPLNGRVPAQWWNKLFGSLQV